MKIRLSTFASLALAIACGSLARADELLPKEQPPVMSTAKFLESGELSIRVVVQVPVQYTEKQVVAVTEFRTEIVGGRTLAKPFIVEKEVEVTRIKYAAEVREQRMKTTEFQVIDLAGKKVDGERLATALAKERPVLVVTKPLEPFYASFFKADMLVIQTLTGESKAAVGVVPAAAPVPVPGGIRIEAAPIRIEAAPIRAVPAPAPAIEFPAIPAIPVPEPVRPKPPK